MAATYDASYGQQPDTHPEHEHYENNACFVQSPEDSTRPGSQQSVLSGFNNVIDMAGLVVKAGQTFVAHQRRLAPTNPDAFDAVAGETPPLLRFLCFLGGLMMTFTNTLAIMNVFTLLTAPPVYVLQAYQLLFGLIIMTLEARDWECFDAVKPVLHDWFRFLTVPAGRGAFYLFVGSLGVSLWLRSFAAFANGLYMAAMGIASFLVHARVGNAYEAVDDPSYGEAYDPEEYVPQ